MTTVTLDIVMPFWGRADHLLAAVESVLAQTDARWRLTVIDDAYPDATAAAWVAAIDDDRVAFVRNAVNVGVSGAFNMAVDHATANDVVIMGCDDVLGPDFVATMLALRADCPDADLLLGGVDVINADGVTCRPLADRVKSWIRPSAPTPTVLEGEALARSLMRGNWAYFPALAWRREAIARIGFNPDDGVVQDLRAIMKLVLSGSSMAIVDTPVFHYRRHAASVSSAAGTDGARFTEERALFKEMEAAAAAQGWPSAVRAAKTHTLSRLHALATLPGALKARDLAGVRLLVRHGLGRSFE